MNRSLNGTITLPGSKSESNRALMIAAYGDFPLEADNLSEANDTRLLMTLLDKIQHNNQATVDCQDAGSVARFLMTYLACAPGEWLLTGTERLCERPMAPLVDALRQLGADITPSSLRGLWPKQSNQNCLPVLIRGKKLKGGPVSLDASLSSQFVTSLLLAAPTWEEGLQLTLTGETVSEPYIDMTISMMKQFGVETVRKGNTITVARQTYHPTRISVSSDWSAASYWYEMLALSTGGSLLLKGLQRHSLQGDTSVVDFFKPLGISTEFTTDGALISSKSVFQAKGKSLEFDFLNTPDLFPAVLVSCVALHIEAVFKHITTLYLKESDRVNSLISELSKIYTFINIIDDNKLVISKSSLSSDLDNGRSLSFRTFGDHRIAMALAALKVRFYDVVVDRPDVVNKSYPTFWDDLGKHFGI